MQVPVRQGLPRVSGGAPWPPVETAEVAEPVAGVATATVVGGATAAQSNTAATSPQPAHAAATEPEMVTVQLRRGLPRTPDGDPWPEAATAQVPAPKGATQSNVAAGTEDAAGSATAAGSTTLGGAAAAGTAAAAATTAAASPNTGQSDAGREMVTVQMRRGLPRTPNGEPWPEAETAQVPAPKNAGTDAVDVAGATGGAEAHAPAASAPQPAQPAEPAEAARPAEPAVPAEPTAPTTPTKPSAPAKPAKAKASKADKADKAGNGASKSTSPWLWGAALVALAAIGVLAARWFVGTDTGASFIERYDGRQPLPDGAPVGFPAWLTWSHFFNMFLMAMIIKTGLTQRTEKKPAAYWAPRSRPREKISVNLWLHIVLDLAWIVLGVIFYILLFATGQWMRIVPTSWETIPHAVSAGLQYLSLDWPSENPWVYYNSLQELSYFLVVFVASPLAIVSGARMSPLWPKQWNFLPMRAARAIHYPTMLFYVIFLVIHVALVLTTGVRGNLNAMFAATDDPTGWTGTILFFIAMAVIAGGWALARPMFVAPLAAKTGNVTQR